MSFDRHRPQRARYPDSESDDDDYARDRGPRRRSALADPSRRKPRSNSKVRLQHSSDDSDEDYQNSRRPKSSRPRDLERKNGPQDREFRERRDGYTSDEGEALKKSRKDRSFPQGLPPPPPGPPFGYPPPPAGNGYPPPPQNSLPPPPLGLHPDMAQLPYRGGRPRASSDLHAPPPPYGDVTRGGPYDEPRKPQRSRSHRDPDRNRKRYDDYSDDEPPRQYKGSRDQGGRDRRRDYPSDNERGYRSDHGARRRDDDPRRRDGRDDRDRYEPRRRDDRRGGGGGYYSDHDDRSSRDPRDRYGKYDDDRRGDRYRSSRGGRSDRDRYDRDDDRRSGRRGKSDGKDWQKTIGPLLLRYAVPYIQKEGTKFAKDFLAKRGARSGGS